MLLSGPQVNKLCGIIVPYFTATGLDQIVFGAFTRRLNEIARVPYTMPTAVFDLISHFDREGQLGTFLSALLASNKSPALAAEIAPFQAMAPRPHLLPQALESLDIEGSPFVNRSELRNYLLEISSGTSSRRVLSVNGDEACGKTYAIDFIRQIARVAGCDIAVVDVGRLGPSLLDVCEDIVVRLRLNWGEMRNTLLDDPKPDRIAMRFWRNLGGMSKHLPIACWLVLDGLSKVGGDSDVLRFLVPHLLEELSQEPIPGIFPIVVGAHAGAVRKLRQRYLHEQVPPLSESHLEEYLELWSLRRKRTLSLEARRRAAVDIMNVTGTRHEQMEAITDNLSKFLEALNAQP